MSATSYNVSTSGNLPPPGGVFSFQITPVGGVPASTDFINLALNVTTVSGTPPVMPIFVVTATGTTSPVTAGTYLFMGFDSQGYPYYANGAFGPFIILNTAPNTWQFSNAPPGQFGGDAWIASANTGLTTNTYRSVPPATGSPASVAQTTIAITNQPVTVNIPIPANFQGSIGVTVGVGGSSTTLGLPIHPPTIGATVAALPANQVIGSTTATDGEGNPQTGIIFNFQLLNDGNTDYLSGSVAPFIAISNASGGVTAKFVSGWTYSGARASGAPVTFTAAASNFELPIMLGP